MRKLLFAILLLGLCHVCTSKRGGGGSRGSFARASRTSGGSSYRISSVRTWSKSQKSVALTAGTVYISSRMRTRYGSPDYYENHDVQICMNKDKYKNYNGTTSEYGWFLCPLDDPNKGHCCGAEGYEFCCNFWKSTAAIGAYVGFALLGIGLIAGIIVLVICLKKKKIGKPAPGNNTVSFNSQAANQNPGTVSPPPPYSYSNPAGPDTTFEKNQYGLYPPPEYQNTGGAPA